MATKKTMVLELGATGAEVTKCQKLLQAAGSGIKVTGEFGIGMASAVRSFQKKNGLEVTGKIDAKTLKKLEESAPKKTPKPKAKKSV